MTDTKYILENNFKDSIYKEWEVFHNSFKEWASNKITKEVCNNIVRAFLGACKTTETYICQKVLDAGYYCPECPINNICMNGGGIAHRRYWEIYRAARDKNIKKVTKLLENIPDEGIKNLKTIRDTYVNNIQR